jgi:hypothetical protein
VDIRKRRMQAKQAIERQETVLRTRCIEREFPTQPGVIAITVGRRQCEAVDGAAQYDQNKANIRVRPGKTDSGQARRDRTKAQPLQ